MKKPDDYIRDLMVGRREGYMRKAEASCKSERGSEEWVGELRSSMYYKRAREWGELERRQNILYLKERQLDAMTEFLKAKGLYEEFCGTLADE